MTCSSGGGGPDGPTTSGPRRWWRRRRRTEGGRPVSGGGRCGPVRPPGQGGRAGRLASSARPRPARLCPADLHRSGPLSRLRASHTRKKRPPRAAFRALDRGRATASPRRRHRPPGRLQSSAAGGRRLRGSRSGHGPTGGPRPTRGPDSPSWETSQRTVHRSKWGPTYGSAQIRPRKRP